MVVAESNYSFLIISDYLLKNVCLSYNIAQIVRLSYSRNLFWVEMRIYTEGLNRLYWY